jgi:hypothetical protein
MKCTGSAGGDPFTTLMTRFRLLCVFFNLGSEETAKLSLW